VRARRGLRLQIVRARSRRFAVCGAVSKSSVARRCSRSSTTTRIIPPRSRRPSRRRATAYLAPEFARALVGADQVILTPIYAASEAPIPGVSERSIGEPLAAEGTRVTYVADVEELVGLIPRIAPPHALVLMLGAGSISSVAHTLGAAIAEPALHG
jgi:UDP-N-acetylmuramate-alanine ligase